VKIYIISDTHFNHEGIVKFCERPYNHEDIILKNIAQLPFDSCLIHLGDFSLGKEAEFAHKYSQYFSGRKVLVMGNHDSKSWNWYMEHGFDFVCDTFRLDYGGKKILFSHVPQAWDGIWEINVHGHLHNLGHREKEHKL